MNKEIIKREEIDSIIDGALLCRLAMAADNSPYVIPLSFGYDGKFIYIHTGKEGKKIRYFEGNPSVCFEFDRDISLVTDSKDPCKWSFSYKSVIGFGSISELTSKEEKIYGLNQIMLHYSHKEWEFKDINLVATRIWKISIDSITGKIAEG
jgi:nitroimidazol reductase NimA-like FMN-containing flavoprotein (pyridoxamine 5'-phosphate oxidase superfamily)